MGCNLARPNTKNSIIGQNIHAIKNRFKRYKSSVNNIHDLNISTADFVYEINHNIEEDYKFVDDTLGRGSFGQVRKAIHIKTGILRAVKIIEKKKKNESEQERLINEVSILKTMDHPNIIKIYGFYQDEKQFYIVSEYCHGGELFDRITRRKHFPEKDALHVMKQILSAVNYCHQNSIVHRDLKPENILYETEDPNSIIKIIDFGTSRYYDPSKKMNHKYGTPYYIAPEVLQRNYGEKCDIWSCGVILYIILCGYPPFNGRNDEEIYQRILNGKLRFDSEDWAHVSSETKKLVKQLLEYDPEKRITATQAIEHTCFNVIVEDHKIVGLQNVVRNLRKFKSKSKLQEIMWLFIVNNLVTTEEKNQYIQIFRTLDVNNDGKLSREELADGLRTLSEGRRLVDDIESIINSVDYDKSGSIDYTEFIAVMLNRNKVLTKERLEMTFKMFDKDGNGYISRDELKQLFDSDRSRKIDEVVWKELINEVDSNGDGQISFLEFRTMMLSYLRILDLNFTKK